MNESPGRNPNPDYNGGDKADLSAIPGLTYFGQFVDRASEEELVQQLDVQLWETVGRGRVQTHRYQFQYTADGAVDTESHVRPPLFLERLVNEGIFAERPECLIVNEYLLRQGIAPHVDVVDGFDSKVVTVSLLALISMVFTNGVERARRGDMILEPRSLLAMEGEARYKWRHGIRAKKSDVIGGSV